MKQTIQIQGMHCNSCVAKIKTALEADNAIESAEVNLSEHSAMLHTSSSLNTAKLKELLSSAGNYSLVEPVLEKKASSTAVHHMPHTEESSSFFSTYKPLLMIVGFLLGIAILVQYPFASFKPMLLMRHFMAGFFIAFSFFKLLNLEGFASSYAMYDIIAAKWKGWGYVYPFVELALGIAYLLNLEPTLVNYLTIAILGVSSIGVIESNLNKRKIKCACLGDVFNLPMSTVTIVEDLSMVAMAALMLIV
jgi:copper chaperone CopZ